MSRIIASESKRGRIVYCSIVMLLCSVFAIGFHAMLPSDVNVQEMNGVLVQLFGFPPVAIFYFVALYIHCSIVMLIFGKGTERNPREVGVRYGLAFGLIYLVGMFEIVPGTTWSVQEGVNQFFIGVGDMVPVLILMLLLSRIVRGDRKARWQPLIQKGQGGIMLSVAILCFLIRMGCYLTGVMGSAIKEYPIPVTLWTMLWAVVFGFVVAMLFPLYKREKNQVLSLVVITIGVNWFWFNSFMALIMKDFLLGVIVRTSIDVIAVIMAIMVYKKITKKMAVHNIRTFAQ